MLSSLVGWHLVILIALVGASIAVGIFFFTRARKTRASGDPTPVVNVTLVIAAFYAAMCLLGAVLGFVGPMLSPAVTMDVPVREYWPLPMPGLTITGGSSAEVVGGGFTTAQLTIENLSPSLAPCGRAARRSVCSCRPRSPG